MEKREIAKGVFRLVDAGHIRQTLNKKQVEEIFADNAVLFGTTDGLPIDKAVEIFGREAVKFAKHMSRDNPGAVLSCYGIGDFTAFCFTLRGAMIAASFNNVCAIRKRVELFGVDYC